MNFDKAQVDTIVRNVLEQLQGTSKAQSSAGVSASTVFQESVLTEELLTQKLNGAKQIEIGAKSVLTPSARDFLRKRNIEYVRKTDTISTTGANWRAIVVQTTGALASALNDMEQTSTHNWDRELVGTNCEAIEYAVSALCRAEVNGAVILTAKPESVACRANRNQKIRAATIECVLQTKQLKADLNPNLLCINPENKSYIELRNLLRASASGDAPRVPTDWNEIL